MAQGSQISELRERLRSTPNRERFELAKRLDRAERQEGAARRRAVESVARAISAAERSAARLRKAVPQQIAYPEELPIVARRVELLETIAANQVVIVAGETGSGKSTQLPKMCLELGRGVLGRIGHTQPRRIAARSIAERVAEELETPVGGLVGYKFRFTDEVGENTLIKVMTDGILLNEMQHDRLLSAYDTIIVDEAHERSLNIDFLLGYLRQLLPRRPDLKVIITSATIDTDRFAAHYDDAPVIEVSGRTYPVEVRYRPLTAEDGTEATDQTDAIVAAVRELSREGPGDILVFCSGEREIRDAAEALNGVRLAHTQVLPLYGRLSAGEQHRVFSAHTGRRVVVATNVAETSLTVPGIRYVVDAGTARISRYSRRTKVQRLPIEAISRASADQRAGRCGRLGPGICIRLYSVEDYSNRPEFTDPEILRTNLASVILQMAAIGLGDIDSFPFIEPPDTRTIRDGIALLAELQAISGERIGTPAWLTEIGRRLARIPLDPRIGRMLIAAADEDCLREALIIASALSIIDPRERPTGKEEHADQLHRRFRDETSDFLSILNLWRYISTERRARTSNQFRRMCRDEFLNWRRIREWQDIHAQLRAVADELKLRRNSRPAAPEDIHRALLAGLLSHVGSKDPDSFEYRGPRGSRFAINPGSALFRKAPPWVMAAELIETSRTWARQVAPVTPELIEEVGSHLIKRTLSDPWWDAARGAAVANETVTLLGLQLASRVILAARNDPEGARRLFIRHALVQGEWESEHSFVAHNEAKIGEVVAMEARGRRADMLVDEDALVRFFDRRIPADVVSVRHFDRWWRQTRSEHPDLLDFSLADLIVAEAADVDDHLYPPQWHYGDVALELSYEFDPSSPSDGVTVHIPVGLLERIDPTVFEWNVPGFRLELIAGLIRSLPKRVRKQFVPVPDTARDIANSIGPETGGIIESLRRQLSQRSDDLVLPDHFDLEAVPGHLRPNFRVVDESGSTLAEGKDLAALRRSLRDEAREVTAELEHPIERSGLTTWDFGELPRALVLQGPEHAVTAYPALVDEIHSVAIRLVATRQEQVEATWSGLRRLLELQLPSPTRLLRSVLDDRVRLGLVGAPYQDESEWMADCMACALDEVMSTHGGLVWNEEDFLRLLGQVRDELAPALESIGEQSATILTRLQELHIGLDGLNRGRFAAVIDDIVDQVGQFIYPGFLSGVGADKLADLTRYLDAALYRAGKVGDNPARDAENMHRVRSLEDELDHLVDSLPWAPAMIEISWMLQELRVSLFAQPVGAKGPVSEKRVRRALDALVQPS